MSEAKRLEHLKESLMALAESQVMHLDKVDTEEYGEVIDMIKDLEEALYYCTITEAMTKNEQHKTWEQPRYMGNPVIRYDEPYGNNTRDYKERELPMEMMQDYREGRSPRSRRMYMEARETHQDKSVQMRELEKYMQELTQDLVEMITDASPEEKQYLEKRLSVLASKVGQMNG